MNEMNRDELQVALNVVCFSGSFRRFYSSRHLYCPSDMTIAVVGDPKGETAEAKKSFYLALVIRSYGYDSSSNKGTSSYDDLQDFLPGSYGFTQEELDTVLEYFRTYKPELYEKYMDGVTFYLDGI